MSVTLSAMKATDRYTIVSADGHAGADITAYKAYLEGKYHEEFDRWFATYENPWQDLEQTGRTRNWDNDERLRDLDADGVVAEVLFPNTIPPFFPTGSLTAVPPTAGEYELRWAGLRAHNRWLVDFCAEAPGRRAGVAQILLNDVDDAVAEVKWSREAGLTGGILLPGVPPGSSVDLYHAPQYEPIWAACAAYDVPINSHGGTSGPEPPGQGTFPGSGAIFIVEAPWFSHRTLWQFIYSGILDRHPNLKLCLTEQGSGWVPGVLSMLDDFHARFTSDEPTMEAYFAGEAARNLSLTPSEFFRRNVFLGSSFMRPTEAALRHEIGVDNIMWGADYPHNEMTTPHTTKALRHTFPGVDPAEIRLMLGQNAAQVYGFDLALLDKVAAEVGPTVDEVAVPLPEGDIPTGAMSAVWHEKISRRPF